MKTLSTGTIFRSATDIERAYAAQKLSNDPEYIMALLDENRKKLNDIDPELVQKNPEIRQIGLRKDGMYLAKIPEDVQTMDDVLTAVKFNGIALQFAKPEFTRDKNILLTAVKINGLALEFVDKSLIKDNPELYFEIASIALEKNALALEFVDKSLIKDNTELYFEIVSIAVKGNGLALKFTTSDLQNNIEIVELAYNQNSESLQFASNRLKKVFDQRRYDQENARAVRKNADELLSSGFHNKKHSDISDFINSLPEEYYTNKELLYHAMVKPLFEMDEDDLDEDKLNALKNGAYHKLYEILAESLDTRLMDTEDLLKIYHSLYKYSDVPMDDSDDSRYGIGY